MIPYTLYNYYIFLQSSQLQPTGDQLVHVPWPGSDEEPPTEVQQNSGAAGRRLPCGKPNGLSLNISLIQITITI